MRLSTWALYSYHNYTWWVINVHARISLNRNGMNSHCLHQQKTLKKVNVNLILILLQNRTKTNRIRLKPNHEVLKWNNLKKIQQHKNHHHTETITPALPRTHLKRKEGWVFRQILNEWSSRSSEINHQHSSHNIA